MKDEETEAAVLMNLFTGDFRVTDEQGRDVTDGALKKLLDGTYERELLAEAAQTEAALMMGTQRFNRKLDMLPVMNVTPEVYWHWVAREGRDCWGDDGFRRDLMRDNPSLRARVEMPQDRVSFAGINEKAFAQATEKRELILAGKYTPVPSLTA